MPRDALTAIRVHSFLVPMPDESAPDVPYKDLTDHVKKTSDNYFAYGGFSEVFNGVYQDESGQQHLVVIKVVRARDASRLTKPKEKLLKRLYREARAWHTLEHPNVLKFLGVVHNMGEFFALVSPFCAKGNITHYLKEFPQSNRLHIILGVAKALEYLHEKNVIHGDFKSSNVLIADDGKPLVSDFGRSKIIGQRGFTSSNMAGSTRFLAPEIIDAGNAGGDDDTDDFRPNQTKETDVYALSMTCVEILSGQQPYPNIRNDNRIIIGVPEGLRPRREEYELPGPHANVWDTLELCWVHIPAERLTMPAIVQQLSSMS